MPGGAVKAVERWKANFCPAYCIAERIKVKV
jgi:hypothetical protein